MRQEIVNELASYILRSCSAKDIIPATAPDKGLPHKDKLLSIFIKAFNDCPAGNCSTKQEMHWQHFYDRLLAEIHSQAPDHYKQVKFSARLFEIKAIWNEWLYILERIGLEQI